MNIKIEDIDINIEDITIYYPLKCGDKYIPTAYSFIGCITSFSNTKDCFDFINASYLTKKECEDMCVLLNKASEK